MAEKEYIEREALIEELETLLSDLRFITKYEKQHGSVSDVEKSKAKLETMKEVISLVKSQPTADVQEVVRCKDCKRFYPYLSFCADNYLGAFGHCQITHMNVNPDFYCGNAEKWIRSDER